MSDCLTFVAESTLTPPVNSSLTISLCPSFDAKCNAFSPFALHALISVPDFRKSKTHSKFPARAARKKLSVPSLCNNQLHNMAVGIRSMNRINNALT